MHAIYKKEPAVVITLKRGGPEWPETISMQVGGTRGTNTHGTQCISCHTLAALMRLYSFNAAHICSA